ncbi:MAG: hypothetical protein ACM3Q2_00260 [Syntrophothermus sp.]
MNSPQSEVLQNEELGYQISENDFNISEFALKGIFNRYKFYTSNNKVGTLPGVECFKSVYLHSESIIKFYEENKNLKGYSSAVAAKYLFLQTKAQDVRSATEVLRKLILSMEEKYSVRRDMLHYMFDGINNFYVAVPAKLFGGFAPSEDLPLIHSVIRSRLSGGIKLDYKVYYHNSLKPVVNTFRKETKLYAISLKHEEIFDESVDIKSLAKQRRSLSNDDANDLSQIDSLVLLKGNAMQAISELRQFLGVLYGFDGRQGIVELRYLDKTGRPRPKFLNEPEKVIAISQEDSGNENIFYGIATRKDDSGGTKNNCLELNVIYADVDYGTAGHKSKPHFSTKNEALGFINALKLPPTALTHSGHGFQLLWKLKGPVILNTDGSTERVERLMRKLNEMLHGDPTQNVDRIFRLPHTLNIKESPSVMCTIERMSPDVSYSLEELEEWGNVLGSGSPAVQQIRLKRNVDTHNEPENKILPFKDWEKVKNQCAWVQNVYLTAEQEKHLSNNAQRVPIANLLLRFEGGEEEIHRIMEKCNDYNKERTDYYISQIKDKNYSTYACSTLCKDRCSNIERIQKDGPFAFAFTPGLSRGNGAQPTTKAEWEDMLKALVIKLVNVDCSLDDIIRICRGWALDNNLPTSEVESRVNSIWDEISALSGPFWEIQASERGLKIEISQFDFNQYLLDQGFAKYQIIDQNEYVFIKTDNNLVKEVELWQIKDFVRDYLKNDEIARNVSRKLLSDIYANPGFLFGEGFIEFLEKTNLKLKKDTKNEAYFYFRNGFVTVNKDSGISLRDYKDLDGFVWESQVIRRDFNIIEENPSKSMFEQFIWNVADKNENRFQTLCSVIGYLLHNYKDSSKAKAIVFLDERISDSPNGRTGKSLVSKAISQLRESVRQDGKNFSFDKEFRFQQVKLSTQVLEFNDVVKDFEFEKLFSVITDSITVEKKREHAFSIPFEESPKILISTNYTIKGTSDSFKARLFEIEFSTHYSADYEPKDDFGKLFFDEWTDEEWNEFYNFMLRCVKLYLEKGLVEYTPVNLKIRKLIESTRPEFEEFVKEELKIDNEYEKASIFTKFIRRYYDLSSLKQNMFTKWLKNYAYIMELEYKERSSSGKQFFTLSKKVKNSEPESEKV